MDQIIKSRTPAFLNERTRVSQVLDLINQSSVGSRAIRYKEWTWVPPFEWGSRPVQLGKPRVWYQIAVFDRFGTDEGCEIVEIFRYVVIQVGCWEDVRL